MMQVARDTSTSAIINTDDSEYLKILERRRQQKTITQMQSQIEFLTDQLNEVKSVIVALTHGNCK